MQHKYPIDSVVRHHSNKAKVVGYCMPEEWANEPRYGIELLDEFYTATYSDGSTKDWPIVKAVSESSLTLIEAPIKKEEPSVAEVVESIEEDNVANAMAPSGVE